MNEYGVDVITDGLFSIVSPELGLTQAQFAERFHLPIGTLRDWEQDHRQPDAPALAYLRVIARRRR